MIIWNTKNALWAGITCHTVSKPRPPFTEMVTVKDDEHLDYLFGEGVEWHRTAESAVEKAEQMRRNEIASLRRRIDSLRKMKFTI